MEYPGSRFTRPYRRIVLALFITSFFVIAPITVLYTIGYRYDWKYGLLRETGSVSIDIEPKTANVYLDGLNLKESMPIRLKNITPHKYTLRFTLPGYHDWQKEIEVKNKQTTYLKEIILLKKSDPKLLLAGKFQTVSLSGNGDFALLRNATSVGLLTVASRQLQIIQVLSSSTPATFTWGGKSAYALLETEGMLTLINAADTAKNLSLTNVLKEQIKKYHWRETIEPELYLSTTATIYSYAPATQQLRPITANKYQDWYVENGSLWSLQISTSTGELSVVKDTLGFSEVVATLGSANIPTQTAPQWHIEKAQGNTIVLSGPQYKKIIVSQGKIFPLDAEHITISPYNNWWLFWSPGELWTLSEGENPYLLLRLGEELIRPLPLDKYNTLALIWKNKVTALFPYYFIEHDFISDPLKTLTADTDRRAVYFIDKTGLWQQDY